MDQAQPVGRIDVISDAICPWCYIGKRHLEGALKILEKDKLPEARPILENVLAKSTSSPFYQTQARLALISVLEEQGEYDTALTQLDQLDKVIDKDLKPKVLLAKGRLQLLKNAKADAKARKSGFTSPTVYRDVMERIGTYCSPR